MSSCLCFLGGRAQWGAGKTGARETITRKAFPGVLMRQLETLRFPLSEQDRALKTPAQPPRFIEEVTGLEGESDLSRVTVPIRAATGT